jgi:hypothetical protein
MGYGLRALAGLGFITILGCAEEDDGVARVLASSGRSADRARLLGQGPPRGKQADPDFDATVAKPAFVTTHPKVLIDEAHHNFHTAAGRYKPFADLIANDGYQVAPNRKKFARDVLATCDVLVVANALAAEAGRVGDPEMALPAFTEAECNAVADWVKAGGALLLITDHYPFGWAAKDLAKRFGVEIGKAYTIDPANASHDPARLVFSRDNGLLADHSITRGRDESERVNRVITFTGQSLQGPEGSVPFLKLSSTALDVRYPDNKQVPVGGRSHGLALTHGKGRVVVLGEATQLTALVALPSQEPLGMNVPGIDNRQMALNIMHWLSGLTAGSPGARGAGR